MTATAEERRKRYDVALARFASWFDRHRKPDGSLDAPNLGVSAYMPVPVYARAIGDAELCSRTLDYIERRVTQDDSFLRPAGKPLLPYRAAWMLMGAASSKRATLAAALERWMLSFQHEPTGGFFGTETARQAGEGETCFDSTTIICAALAEAGKLEEAKRAGEFLVRLIHNQAACDERFHLVWSTQQKGVVTQFDPQQARLYVIEWNQPHQYLYKIGLLARAFTNLYFNTSNLDYLDFAETFYKRAAKSPEVWTNTLAHKLGWAAYSLHCQTHKPEYLEGACRVADHVAILQQPDGAFHYPEFWPPYEQVSIEQKFNIGCQFATWIACARALIKREEMEP
jgi:hypothetical protein